MPDKGKFSEEEAFEKAFGDVLAEKEGKKEKKNETAKPGASPASPASPAAGPTPLKKDIKPEPPQVKQAPPTHLDLIREIADSKEKYLRLLAEFENVRKRNERERIEFVKYANEELLSQFLAILDDLERSVEAAKTKHEDYDAFLKGIELVMAHVYDMLKKNSVKPIEAKGKKFDPHMHEPLMQEETDQYEEGTVLEELQKGYMLGDRVVRTSKVKVAKSKTNKT